jgi:hypothetical protein
MKTTKLILISTFVLLSSFAFAGKEESCCTTQSGEVTSINASLTAEATSIHSGSVQNVLDAMTRSAHQKVNGGGIEILLQNMTRQIGWQVKQENEINQSGL